MELNVDEVHRFPYDEGCAALRCRNQKNILRIAACTTIIARGDLSISAWPQ